MPDELLAYEFAGLKFSPFAGTLENLNNSKKIKLTQTHSHFLLALIQKSPEIVEYNELRESVWVEYAEMTESLKRLIQTTKGKLVETLKHAGFPADFIQNVPGKGYKIEKTVTKFAGENKTTENFEDVNNFFYADKENNLDLPSENLPAKKDYTAFKIITALFYGLLFWLALLLEIAYQFDDYGTTALLLGLPLIGFNGGVLYFALWDSERRVLNNRKYAFEIGVVILISGAILSCLFMLFFLPFEPITAARFQSQPAFAAFLKNVLLYFLPLGVFMIYMPFYFIVRQSYKKLEFYLPKLFGLLLLALMYSLFSTFYLLDNLLVSEYHWLFVTLVFLRFVTYFGLALVSLIWSKNLNYR